MQENIFTNSETTKAMFYYMDRIEAELNRILKFWQKNVLTENSLYTEISAEGINNENAPIGNVFLSGVIYGASAITRFFNNDVPLHLAQLAYNEQQLSLSNTDGGYLFGKQRDGQVLHEPYMAGYTQAYVAIGLIEYFKATKSNATLTELKTIIDFSEKTIADPVFGGYAEGFTRNWKSETLQKKTLLTHLRMMEAYAGYYKLTNDKLILAKLEEMIGLTIHYFFNDKKLNLYSEFTANWTNPISSNNMGVMAETSWLLFHCAKVTRNADFIEQSAHIAIQLTGYLMEFAYDNQYGGVFSHLTEYQTPQYTDKEWWVQTESTLAFLNSYEITGDKTYLSYATRLFEYIDCTFSDEENGEWYDSVTREGRPILTKPKIHFSKSLHLIVRYCIEVHKRFKHISQTAVRHNN